MAVWWHGKVQIYTVNFCQNLEFFKSDQIAQKLGPNWVDSTTFCQIPMKFAFSERKSHQGCGQFWTSHTVYCREEWYCKTPHDLWFSIGITHYGLQCLWVWVWYGKADLQVTHIKPYGQALGPTLSASYLHSQAFTEWNACSIGLPGTHLCLMQIIQVQCRIGLKQSMYILNIAIVKNVRVTPAASKWIGDLTIILM